MAWTAPITTYVSNNGWGFADANKINANLTYLREETATFNGVKTFTNTLYVAGSILQTINTSSINLAPGTITNKGGNVTLFGETHPVFPGRIQFRNNADISMIIDNKVISIDGTMLKFVDDGTINIAAGTATNFGGNIGLFGKDHPVYPDRIQFRSGSISVMTLDPAIVNILKPTTITGVLTVDPTLGITAATTIELKKPTTVTGALIATGITSELQSYRYIDSNFSAGLNALSSITSLTKRNTCVGNNAGDNITTGENNLILGFDAKPAFGNTNNQVVLGNNAIEQTYLKGTVNVAGELLPTTIPTDSNWQVTTTPIIIPRGMYMCNMIVETTVGSYSYIQMKSSGTWFTISSGQVSSGTTANRQAGQNGSMIMSDGVNFRVVGSTAGAQTMYYRKF